MLFLLDIDKSDSQNDEMEGVVSATPLVTLTLLTKGLRVMENTFKVVGKIKYLVENELGHTQGPPCVPEQSMENPWFLCLVDCDGETKKDAIAG